MFNTEKFNNFITSLTKVLNNANYKFNTKMKLRRLRDSDLYALEIKFKIINDDIFEISKYIKDFINSRHSTAVAGVLKRNLIVITFDILDKNVFGNANDFEMLFDIEDKM